MQVQRLRIRGVVQGVGFRPAVWHIAQSLSLKGSVLNDGEGVVVDLWCSQQEASDLIERLIAECPPLASIESVESAQWKTSESVLPPDGFTIAESHESSQINAGIPVDACICKACADETLDPQSRRYRYPFTNCTHCGPRLSIIKALPYDRPKTSMAAFPLCAACESEYRNPADRRFHAQPVACPECGPSVWLTDASGKRLEIDSVDAIDAASTLIVEGKILAVKGLGGFHLVCDATNEEAVTQLRLRKRRPAKPFAVMMPDLEMAELYCALNDAGREVIQSAASPVLIAPQNKVTTSHKSIANSIAPGLDELGIMLPATPLHLLLCRDAGIPLVMTSANLSGNPQCIDNDEALADLADIADFFLLHDRDIVVRVDDSVMRQTASGMQTIRRARGFAPSPLRLPAGFGESEKVLALGGEVKNAFCLLSSRGAVLGQYVGDLESARVWDDFNRLLSHYQRLYRFEPQKVAVDAHPEYIASKYGRAAFLPEQRVEVQHHHAHVAACMGDNGQALDSVPVIGVVFDGLGFGEDGTLWGGEFLLVDYRHFSRIAHLKPAALPGGATAIKQPWRNLVARFGESGSREAFLTERLQAQGIELSAINTVKQMVEKGFNAPISSSAGRLFDSVSAALDVCTNTQTYEGQAAIELEALAHQSQGAFAYPFGILDGNLPVLDPTPMWQALCEDLESGLEAPVISRRFHLGLAQAVVDMVQHLSLSLGTTHKIALSGGVFQNKLLLEQTVERLQKRGFEVLLHRQVPANDGGLAFGQALIAAALSLHQHTQSLGLSHN